jgi:AbrB family looped-hinge helix DNA binding protein
LASTKLRSKNQITIPKKVVEVLGLESGDRLRLEIKDGQIILTSPSRIANPTEELYGSVKKKKKLDAVKAIRDFRKAGGRA